MEPFSRMGISQGKSSIQGLRKKVTQAQNLLTDEDYFQKAFLKPIEIALKSNGPGLPSGLNLVLKDDVSANKFKTTVFDAPDIKEWSKLTYQQMIQKNYDNLFSLMKSTEGIQLAICVCMYSQDKKMLKNTLAGIAENIDLFVKGGLSTDKIAVIVIMDGIEKVDASIPEYFDELQRQSSIMLSDQSQPMGLHDFLFSKNQNEERYQEQVTNINRILFTEAELFERQQKRFSTRIKQYQRVRDLIDLVQKLKSNKGLTYDILDPRIQDFFIEVARERRKQEYGQDQDQLKAKDKQFFIDEYANDVVKSRPIIMEALVRAKHYCEDYIKSRQSLSIVNYFRTSVFVKRKASEVNENGDAVKTEVDQQQDQCKVSATRMNLFLCTKYKNAGKLSSHNWFFNGFCRELNPKYAVLLDVGLRPQKNALFKMYKHMLANQNVGGVCGYMGLRIQRVQDQLGYNQQLNEEEDVDCISRIILKFVDIQRAQQMEYHFAHLIDKSFQSQFKFIHVLPGAFSAYNMEALHANNLLEEYFKSLQQKINNSTIVPSRYTAFDVIMKTVLPDALYYMFWPIDPKSQEQLLYNQNIYLAEDRILCMGIHKNGKDMAFLPDAYAWVDPIKNVHTLLGQRKRWINGSFFAFDKVKAELSAQDQCQPLLRFQMYYLSFMNMLAYVAPALFMFTVSIAIQVFRTDVLMVYFSDLFPTQVLEGFVYLINFIYTMTMVAIIFYSMHLTNKHKKFIPYIYAASMMLGVFALIVFVILAVDIFRGSQSFLITNQAFIQQLPFSTSFIDSMRYIIIAILLLYAIPVGVYVFLYRKFSFAVDMVFGAFSFLFFSPTYLNILNIYALSRINDISWGTKGLDANTSTKNAGLQQTWNIIRLLQVGKYLFWNIITGLLLLTLGAEYVTRFLVTFVIMLILGLSLAIKVFIGIYYLVIYFMRHRTEDPPIDAVYNDDSRINDFYVLIKPSIESNIRKNLQITFNEIQMEIKNAGPKSVVMWGGKSKILQPNKKKQALKKGFQALQKLNASRIVKKDPVSLNASQFKGRYKLAADKTKYKKNRGDTLSSDKSSDRQLNAAIKPAKSKDKFKKYRDVIQIKTSADNNTMKQRPAVSKDKYRKKSEIKQENPKYNEDEIGGEGPMQIQRAAPVGKDKYKKSGKK